MLISCYICHFHWKTQNVPVENNGNSSRVIEENNHAHCLPTDSGNEWKQFDCKPDMFCMRL